MADYRRLYVRGGTFFFTIVTFQRRPLFAERGNRERLREALRAVRAERWFEIVAAVVLPDHMHFIWSLPDGDGDYSWRIGRMKVLFTRSIGGSAGGAGEMVGGAHPATEGGGREMSRARHRERDVWQRRFWEHGIRDERDLENHFNYVHYNPVKHGLASCPHAWEATTFHHWMTRGVYEQGWCCSCGEGGAKVPYPVEMGERMGE